MHPLNSERRPLVELSGITKTFVGNLANDSVDFDLQRGEVHALLGENGAGKSTLMNILCGLYRPDTGEITVEGEMQSFSNPRDAIEAGIGMVHQHFMLVPVQSVWENMILGQESQPFMLRRRRIVKSIRHICDQYGLDLEPEARVWQLSIGEQQRVAILKMLYRHAKILILDEPTAVLTPQEAERLFETVRKMKAEGHGVIFISHKLDEVMAIADRVTVLRKGKKVTTLETRDTTEEELAELMVGEKIVPVLNRTLLEPGRPVLEAQGIGVTSDKDLPAVRELSLELRANEILGVAGVDGNGQKELCEALTGLRPITMGSVAVDGRDLTGRSPREYLDAGVAYIPADRRGMGLIGNMNLRENYALRKYWQKPYEKGLFINWEVVAGHTGRLVEKYDVATPSLGIPVRMLSGGNLQKLMLGRELTGTPHVVIAMQPTWGLDVGATAFVREKLLEQRERGAGVLLISEDLEELLALSDRLAVIHKGRFMGLLDDPGSVTEELLGRMMAGARLEEIEPSGEIPVKEEDHVQAD